LRRFFLFLILLALLAGVVYSSIAAVPDGSVGILSMRIPPPRFFKLSPSLSPGLHLVLPVVTRVHLYSIRVRMLSLDVPIDGGKKFRLTAQVRLDPDSAPAIHRRLGPNYLDDVTRPTVQAILEREVYRAGGDVSHPEHQQQIYSAIAGALASDGLWLDQAILARLEMVHLTEEEFDSSDTDPSSD